MIIFVCVKWSWDFMNWGVGMIMDRIWEYCIVLVYDGNIGRFGLFLIMISVFWWISVEWCIVEEGFFLFMNVFERYVCLNFWIFWIWRWELLILLSFKIVVFVVFRFLLWWLIFRIIIFWEGLLVSLCMNDRIFFNFD